MHNYMVHFKTSLQKQSSYIKFSLSKISVPNRVWYDSQRWHMHQVCHCNCGLRWSILAAWQSWHIELSLSGLRFDTSVSAINFTFRWGVVLWTPINFTWLTKWLVHSHWVAYESTQYIEITFDTYRFIWFAKWLSHSHWLACESAKWFEITSEYGLFESNIWTPSCNRVLVFETS